MLKPPAAVAEAQGQDVGGFGKVLLMETVLAFPGVPTPLVPGSVAGPWRIEACLGEDLDGFDYLVEDPRHGRTVLLREACPVGLVQRVAAEVVPVRGAEADFSDWLTRWTDLLGHWQQAGDAIDPIGSGHGALVPIEARGLAHGTAWAILGPPVGRTLREVVERGSGRLDRAWVDAGLQACCEALDALHRLGEFHGSLTPERVRVRDDGAWCLALPDTDPSRQPLSPWLALEQTDTGRVGGLTLGPWTDVHGLAALAHWLLTGAAPPGLLRRQAGEADLWQALDQAESDPGRRQVWRRALALRPADRIDSIAALRQALGWPARPVPALTPLSTPETAPAELPAAAPRRRVGVVMLAWLLAGLSVIAGTLWRSGGASAPPVAAVVGLDEAGASASAPASVPEPKAASASSAASMPALASGVPRRGPAAVVASTPTPKPARPPATAQVRRPPPSPACIDWLRRRSLEPDATPVPSSAACE